MTTLQLTVDEEREAIRERARSTFARYRAMRHKRKQSNHVKWTKRKYVALQNPFDPVAYPLEYRQWKAFTTQVANETRRTL